MFGSDDLFPFVNMVGNFRVDIIDIRSFSEEGVGGKITRCDQAMEI